MKHPDPEKIREMCDMMKVTSENYDIDIDMAESDITTAPGCGTVCCHGGLFAFAWYEARPGYKFVEPSYYKHFGDDTQVFAEVDRHGMDKVTFEDGASLMAAFIDFPGHKSLGLWAEGNPHIWGNEHGALMFQSAFAFSEKNDTITVQKIIDHWRAVADRIETLPA